MINRRVLEDLLQQPLGPYHDHDILDGEACQMKGTTRLVLYSFILEHNDRITGLDQSEKKVDGRDNRRFRFRGKLKIANPKWLSEFGLKTVQTELNLRAKERAMREGERSPSEFTLEDLFANELLTRSNDATCRKRDEMTRKGDETRLVVLIQGERNMPAVYMHSVLAPNGLLWASKAHGREYQVATMDTETYSQSENFFWRWRLLALMKKITSRFQLDLAKNRTPEWFARAYLGILAASDDDKHRRVLFDDSDSDVDEAGRTTTLRHPLRPHMSELLGLFAAHAEWLVANATVKQEKLIDPASWLHFANQVREERKEAAMRGVKWGLPIGKELEEESSEDDDSGSGVDRVVKNNPVIGKANDIVARRMRNTIAKPDRGTKKIASSESETEEEVGGPEYVLDFSEPSDAEECYSDNGFEEDEIVDRIPWQLQLPPVLPDVDGRWWCPLQECNYQIDLHNLTDGERKVIPRDLREYIQQKRWQNAAYDHKVCQGFKYMVTSHYSKHFEERGVKLKIERDGKTRFTCTDERRKCRGVEEPIRGPMPARGTLGGEGRVVPIVHAPQGGYFE